jgi:hypothetical protein
VRAFTAVLVVLSTLAAGCASAPAARQSVVLMTSPDVGGVRITGIVPSETTLNFSLPPMYNESGSPIRLTSVEMVSPSDRAIRVLNVRAYLISQVGVGWFNGYQGNLPKNCPEHFKPKTVNAVLIGRRAHSNWLVVLSLIIRKPEHIHLGKVKITYVADRHSGWQYYYLNVFLNVVSPSSIPGHVRPLKCRSPRSS